MLGGMWHSTGDIANPNYLEEAARTGITALQKVVP